MKRALGSVRNRSRQVAVAAVIGVGLFASFATSGGTTTTHRTPWFSLQVADLRHETTEAVRLCPNGEFERRQDPLTYAVRARVDGLQPAAASIPVELSVDGHPETARLNLQWGDETRRIQLAVAPDPDGAPSDCSPWARVAVGPLEGDPGEAVVQWQLIITAQLASRSTGRLEFEGAQ